jgi:hypothetical protein
MTKEQIIQALRNDYADCMHRSAHLEESSNDEYLEGVLDGRARGALHAIELLKQLEPNSREIKKTANVALRDLYLINSDWTSNSILHIKCGYCAPTEDMTAHEAIVRFGTNIVRLFTENHVSIFPREPES